MMGRYAEAQARNEQTLADQEFRKASQIDPKPITTQPQGRDLAVIIAATSRKKAGELAKFRRRQNVTIFYIF